MAISIELLKEWEVTYKKRFAKADAAAGSAEKKPRTKGRKAKKLESLEVVPVPKSEEVKKPAVEAVQPAETVESVKSEEVISEPVEAVETAENATAESDPVQEPEPETAVEPKPELSYRAKDVLKVIESIKKESAKYKETERFAVSFKYGEYVVATDTHCMIRTTCDEIKPDTDFPILTTVDQLFSIDRLDDFKNEKVPSVKELKAMEKQVKKEYREANGGKLPRFYTVVYTTSDGEFTMNLKYLIDGLTATDTKGFVWKNGKSPAYFFSTCDDSVDAQYLALPIRLKDDEDKVRAVHGGVWIVQK